MNFLAVTPFKLNLGTFGPKTPGGYQPTNNVAADLSWVVSNILGIITAIAGLTFLFWFVFGAFNWIVSGGDPQKAQTAKATLTNAFLGLVITVIAYPVALLFSKLLGIPLAEPQELIKSLFP
ncbi:MAG: hypothetical protein NTZ93_04290 [Candidatus Beckwithbacteria bacterium]|nr:hypothetical protein [Candidatus Beckwithbacteria bacterium]